MCCYRVGKVILEDAMNLVFSIFSFYTFTCWKTTILATPFQCYCARACWRKFVWFCIVSVITEQCNIFLNYLTTFITNNKKQIMYSLFEKWKRIQSERHILAKITEIFEQPITVMSFCIFLVNTQSISCVDIGLANKTMLCLYFLFTFTTDIF